jgi:protein-tyrosine-phosphatase
VVVVAGVAQVQWLISTNSKTIPKVSGSFYFYIIKYSMKKKLLFVCVENSNRSQMSQAFAKMLGGENVEAYSAGSKPSGIVNPKAIAAMKDLGYDLSKHESKSLKEVEQFAPFDAVITMGCGDACPWMPAKKFIDWEIPDPKNMGPAEFNKIRDLIGNKVKELLQTL